MKKSSVKILATILLLLTFVSGQVIVFAHTHQEKGSQRVNMHYKKAAAAASKCPVCDQNSHVQLFLQLHCNSYYSTVTFSFSHPVFVPGYQSIKLLISGNKGPPVS